MKKIILFILWLLFALTAGCGNAVPFTYDGLEGEIEAARVEGDAERIEKAEARLERFEDTALRAERYFETRVQCHQVNEYVWYCDGKERYNSKRPPTTTDEVVKVYRYDRHTCGCVKKAEMLRGY